MGYKLGRFRDSFDVTTRRLRAKRRQALATPVFSHYSEDNRPMFQIPNRGFYSQADLKKFFGLTPKVPQKARRRQEQKLTRRKKLLAQLLKGE